MSPQVDTELLALSTAIKLPMNCRNTGPSKCVRWWDYYSRDEIYFKRKKNSSESNKDTSNK